jgi:hypothetical protein
MFAKFLAAMLIGLFIIGILIYVVIPWLTPKPLPPAPPYNFKVQMEFMNWTLCQRQDAIQMYIQNPGSNNPIVIKLKQDITLYNGMAQNLRINGTNIKDFSISDCAHP